MHKKATILLITLLIACVFCYAQSKTAIPQKGEGLHAFLIRNKLSVSKHKTKFIELNKGKFGKNNSLLAGVVYELPDDEVNFEIPLFGKKYKKFKQRTTALNGAVFYLVSGHGGPDPGAVGHYMKKPLHEDEYAYDVTLRLARKLMENGAKVYVIIQDIKDGIRDAAVLSNSKRETCMGKRIPINQLKRLKQRTDAVNKLYHKDKSSYKRCIVLHVDSRTKTKKLDVFFYHHPKSSKGKRLVNSIADTFSEKYGKHQPGRGFSGTVSDRELYVVRKTIPPVAFIELGNIQNRRDQLRFVKPNNRQALANWIYEGIKNDFQKK
ncbi:N-acetylmuramoyl-L-alanine amidase [Balneicella halophila]|uniref:N-acetylmuramoyl-L-alanine amidase n=1 Tax=Balneicella halophila TaxID=1537566 RepID=A0A7L4UPA3_BALHA|nr:N-acetylmuramoyl-L-alanine amidase [Balneicella halophila]PVX50955.1 N-acetylmuramoyl-L-alanine amidase [Balneicella halophila]